MKFFTRNETIAIALMLMFIIGLTLANLQTSNLRARDSQRRSDVGAVSNSIQEYLSDFGFYPPSVDGQILACKGDKFDEFMADQKSVEIVSFFELLKGCTWGQSSLVDLVDGKIYMKNIPRDPKWEEGYEYVYFSNGKRFQIYAFLEGERDAEQYSESALKRDIWCGVNKCNFGLVSGDTPLDRSIEVYEAELSEKGKERANAK